MMMLSKKNGFSKSYNSGAAKETLTDNEPFKSSTEEADIGKDIEMAENNN